MSLQAVLDELIDERLKEEEKIALLMELLQHQQYKNISSTRYALKKRSAAELQPSITALEFNQGVATTATNPTTTTNTTSSSITNTSTNPAVTSTAFMN